MPSQSPSCRLHLSCGGKRPGATTAIRHDNSWHQLSAPLSAWRDSVRTSSLPSRRRLVLLGRQCWPPHAHVPLMPQIVSFDAWAWPAPASCPPSTTTVLLHRPPAHASSTASIAMKHNQCPSLLLLPSPPDPANREALEASYRPPITAALSKTKDPAGQAKLTIAVACPILRGQHARLQTVAWTEAQLLLAAIYTILSSACAKLAIPTEVDGGLGCVDATVILVHHDRERPFSDSRPVIQTNNTVVLDLASFAFSHYPWNHVFSVGTAAGLQLHQTFLRFSTAKQMLRQEHLVTVQGGRCLLHGPTVSPEPVFQTSGYPTVCLGGTFDHLHPGHKLLLTAAALLLSVPPTDAAQVTANYWSSCSFIIGVTGDELLKKKKYAEYVQSWDDRARGVLRFLATVLELYPHGWDHVLGPRIVESTGNFKTTFRQGAITAQCVRIDDVFGPTITRENIDALVVSTETRIGGKAVNDRRVEQGWRKLDVFEVDILDAEENDTAATGNFASKISSSTIRKQRAEIGSATI